MERSRLKPLPKQRGQVYGPSPSLLGHGRDVLQAMHASRLPFLQLLGGHRAAAAVNCGVFLPRQALRCLVDLYLLDAAIRIVPGE